LTSRATEGPYGRDLPEPRADAERAVAGSRARGSRLDGGPAALVAEQDLQVRGGRFVEGVAVPTDHAAFDAFWA